MRLNYPKGADVGQTMWAGLSFPGFGRAPLVLEDRRKIKDETLKLRPLHHQAQVA